LPHAAAIPTDLLNELRRLHRTDHNRLDHDFPELRLRALTGGRNNRVFAWDAPDGEVCLKFYRTDKRDRAASEYQALHHIATCGVTAAPTPLWHDPHPELPAIAMTMVAGQPVPDLAEPTIALHAAVTVLSQLREIPLGPFTDIPRVDSAKNYLKRITETWPTQLDQHNDEPCTADMRSLLRAWHARGDAAVLAEPAPRIFSRGDSNLLNWLWHESNIHLVDWEFTGYSDTAYDAADLVEHPSAHTIDDERWISLLPNLGVDCTTRRRFRAAQRTVALRWLSVLWKRRAERADEFALQAKRVREMMNSDSR
jgi:Ser/Thr protein kinase RdoA (MazF antagonist)